MRNEVEDSSSVGCLVSMTVSAVRTATVQLLDCQNNWVPIRLYS